MGNLTKDNKNKKINNNFIACIVLLMAAITISVVYWWFALNEKLEVNENTMGAIEGAIAFSVFLILPLLIWLITLLVKKQVFIYIKDENMNEQQRGVIFDDKIDIVTINKIVDEYLKNKKLCDTIKGFFLFYSAPLYKLEFASMPLILSGNDSYKLLNNNDINGDSVYMQFLIMIKKKLIFKYSLYVAEAYNFQHSKTELLKPDMLEVWKLYSALVNQKIIKNKKQDINSIIAFAYVAYRCAKMRFYDISKDSFDKYGIDFDEDNHTVIEKLYNNDCDSEVIKTVLWARYSSKRNFNDFVCESIDEIDELIKWDLNDLIEKQKIKQLSEGIQPKKQYSIYMIDLMSGKQFEEFITYLFNNLGYKATQTKLSGDQGIDVIAFKGQTKIAIQAKCYHKPVGNHAIMEAVAGARHYKADKVLVVTNNTFTKSAIELAESNGVILWDRTILKEKMEQV